MKSFMSFNEKSGASSIFNFWSYYFFIFVSILFTNIFSTFLFSFNILGFTSGYFFYINEDFYYYGDGGNGCKGSLLIL
jgi:hypothetical protein